MSGSDIANAFYSLPVITRYWFASTIAFSLIGKIGIISPFTLVLFWDRFFYNYEIWRPITALFYYPVTPNTGFHFLVNLYFLYSYSSRLETGMFFGRTADYAFLFLFSWISLVIIGFMATFLVLLEPMVLVIIYVWSQLNRDVVVQFWFGMTFKAMYLPWVLVIFNMIVRGGALMELVGIVVGHLYYFFMFQYPQEYGGRTLLKTPEFLYRIFPRPQGLMSGFGQAPRSATQDRASTSNSRFPGSGQALGRDT